MATWNDLSPEPVTIHDEGVARKRVPGPPSEPYYDSFGEFQLLARDGDVAVPRIAPEEPLKLQARFFVDAVQRGDATMCAGERARDVISTLEAIDESMRHCGAPVARAPARRIRAVGA
jgi:hypothetical protein